VLLAARSSKCKAGSMACAIASPSGELLVVHTNGPLWESSNSRRPNSDVHAEMNALGFCVRRGIAIEGATVFITMPPCKRCFSVLAGTGISRIVSRKMLLKEDARDVYPTANRIGIELLAVPDTEERRARVERLWSGKRALEPDAEPDVNAVASGGATPVAADAPVDAQGVDAAGSAADLSSKAPAAG